MHVQEQISQLLLNIPNVIAVGAIDMCNAMLLGTQGTASEQSPSTEFWKTATDELVRGENLITFDRFSENNRNQSNVPQCFEDFLFLSNRHLHYFIRHPFSPFMLWIICSKEANIGLTVSRASQIAQYTNPGGIAV